VVTQKKKVDKELYEVLHNKMLESGWDSVRSFTNGSKVPFSVETTRRIFNECDYKGLAPTTVAIVAKYLGFTTNEIRDLLRDYTTDRDLWPLIGDSTTRLSTEEEAMVTIYNAIKDKKPELVTTIAEQIQTLCKLAGVDVSEQTKKLIR